MFIWHSDSSLGSLAALLRQFERLMEVRPGGRPAERAELREPRRLDTMSSQK